MAVTPVTNVNGGSLASAEALASRIPSRTLGQDDFLELVVAQMTNQDPLNPRQDTEFIAQMAQFTALEQSKTMQADIELLRADSMIGRYVELNDSTTGKVVKGQVSAVQVEEGKPKLIINGLPYGLSSVLSVRAAANP
jgi:flagellar basal-body rod modification protein FlgD